MRIMLTAAMLLAPAMTGAATTPAATPNAMMTLGAAGAVRPKLPKMAAVQPVPVTAKLALLRNKGIVVRDLPTGPPKVTVAKPVVPGLSLSFYGIFAVSADMDIAMQQDGAGFFAIYWSYEPGRAYLVDCEMSGPATVETSSEGSGWLPGTAVANGHMLFALPGITTNGGATRAFAMRSKAGALFHGCEVSKVGG